MSFNWICIFYCTIAVPFYRRANSITICPWGYTLAEQILLFLYCSYLLRGAFVIYEVLSGCAIKSLVQMMERHLSWGLWNAAQTKCQLVCILHSDFKVARYFSTLQNTGYLLPLVHSRSLITYNRSYSSELPSLVSYTSCRALGASSFHHAFVALLHTDSVCITMSISSGSSAVLVVLQKQRQQTDKGFELSLAPRQQKGIARDTRGWGNMCKVQNGATNKTWLMSVWKKSSLISMHWCDI